MRRGPETLEAHSSSFLLGDLSVECAVPTELDTVISQNNERGKRQRETQRKTWKQIVCEAGEILEAGREASGQGTSGQGDLTDHEGERNSQGKEGHKERENESKGLMGSMRHESR